MAQEKGQVLIEKNKNGSGKVNVRNMQAKPINQAQGPRMGNAGSAEKRATFVKEKASSGNEKSAIANMITDALAGRGAGMQGRIDPTVEGLHSDTGPKRNPTAGGTHYKMTGRK
jgi:hypothetical protein